MRSIIPSSATNSRSLMVAVVLGTALTAGGNKTASAAAAATRATRTAPTLDPTPDPVRDITRYCQVCWRNARVPVDRWSDCTQQVFARLLERVPTDRWADLLKADDEATDRKEFFRAIDTVKKRSQRTRRFADLAADVRDDRHRTDAGLREQREAVDQAARQVLSPRQQRIVELSADGWAVPDIAAELKTTPERVSDEKYKAIRKLRVQLGVSEG